MLLEQDVSPAGRSKYSRSRPASSAAWPTRLSYFKPGFHPWDHDDRLLIRKYDGEFSDALMPAE